MSDIGIFTPEQARMLWQDYLSRQQLTASVSKNLPQRRQSVERTTRRLTGKLDGELVVATNFSTTPATATMSVWFKNKAGNMEDSTHDITVTNRMLFVSLPVGIIVQAEWIDGEWRIYATDCEAG